MFEVYHYLFEEDEDINKGLKGKFYETEASKYRHGVSAKGVHLTKVELIILLQLIEFRLLNTKQIQRIYSHYDEIKGNTLRKKLNRWHEREVIHKLELERFGFGNDVNIYRIDKKGIEILKNEGYLDRDLNISISHIDKIKNLDHFLATNQVLIETLYELNSSIPGIEAKMSNDSRKIINEMYGIIPDAVIEFGNVKLYIETDMGTESIGELTTKLKKYGTIAKEDKNHIHIVAIALLDDSFQTRKYYEIRGNIRKANIKKANIYNDQLFEGDLRICLSDFRNIPKLVFDEAVGSFRRNINNLKERFITRFQEKENLTLMEIDLEIDGPSKVVDYPPHGIFDIYNNAGNKVERVALLFMNKSDLKLNVVLNNIYNNLTDNLFIDYINRLLIVYETKEERENDALGFEYANRVLFTDLETLEEGTLNSYYVSVNPYKCKRVEFY